MVRFRLQQIWKRFSSYKNKSMENIDEKNHIVVNQTEDESFDIVEDENGEETLIDRTNNDVNTQQKALTELLYDLLTSENLEPKNHYLHHSENSEFIIIIVDGGVFIHNETKNYLMSLTEAQVVFRAFEIKERNFWDFDCKGYKLKEFTQEQIIKNTEKW